MLVALSLCAEPISAQSSNAPVVIVVSDVRGIPIPFAAISLRGTGDRVADADGVLTVRMSASDSVKVRARRIGFRERVVTVARTNGDTIRIALESLAAQLATVTVEERANTPLNRTGFYDRMQRVQNGAITGEFITPEELEARNVMQVSTILQGRRGVRVARTGKQQVVLLGRGGCGMTIVLDGQRLNNTVEESVQRTSAQSINANAQFRRPREEHTQLSVDELVNGANVVAVEIYTSTANAPAELINLTGGGSCGIIAIWTGPRK